MDPRRLPIGTGILADEQASIYLLIFGLKPQANRVCRLQCAAAESGVPAQRRADPPRFDTATRPATVPKAIPFSD